MTVTHALKPTGYYSELSEFEACIFDGSSGKPIGWGFGIQQYLGESRFNALRQFGTLEYYGGSWFLITHWLTRQEAEKEHGPVTREVFGPKGGFKSVTFGTTQFIPKHLRPSPG